MQTNSDICSQSCMYFTEYYNQLRTEKIKSNDTINSKSLHKYLNGLIYPILSFLNYLKKNHRMDKMDEKLLSSDKFSQYFKNFLKNISSTLAKSTVENYEKSILKYFQWIIDNYKKNLDKKILGNIGSVINNKESGNSSEQSKESKEKSSKEKNSSFSSKKSNDSKIEKIESPKRKLSFGEQDVSDSENSSAKSKKLKLYTKDSFDSEVEEDLREEIDDLRSVVRDNSKKIESLEKKIEEMLKILTNGNSSTVTYPSTLSPIVSPTIPIAFQNTMQTQNQMGYNQYYPYPQYGYNPPY